MNPKRLVIVVLLLFLLAPVKGTYGRGNDQPALQSQDEVAWYDALTPPTLPEGGSGQGTYLTHPEFDDVMTATVTTAAQNTGDGLIFLAAASRFYPGPSVLLIVDDTGEPTYINVLPGDNFISDFKKQTVNGVDYLTYNEGTFVSGYSYGSSYVLDQNYQLVDTWTMQQGGGSDLHELLLLDNGHAIQLAYVPTPMDLTPYGGPPNGTIIDIVLQEQDENKNVVFEWVASDHLPIGDTQEDLNTTEPIDFLHTNAITVDTDGNWLVSHRHFSEITKINRQTGDVMWRMGGAGNEFTFTNDIGFSNQHDIRRLPNGHITLFDNGNFHNPPYSRAVEYAVDENAKTVTRVWEQLDGASGFSAAMGNIQRLANGNTMIGWGSRPKFTEVHSDGSVALEMLLTAYSYRAVRFPWDGTPLEAPRAVIQYGADTTAATIYTSWNGATDIESYDVYAGPTPGNLSLVGNEPRSGFETMISLTGLPANTCFFKTKPVHTLGGATPYSNQMFRVDIPFCYDQLEHSVMPIFFK